MFNYARTTLCIEDQVLHDPLLWIGIVLRDTLLLLGREEPMIPARSILTLSNLSVGSNFYQIRLT